jgi:ABC-type multidrug transport system fused ATPase/permease subunit
MKTNLSYLKQPEHPLIIITLIYIIIFVILTLAKPKSVPLGRLQIGIIDLHFFIAWAFCLVGIVTFFCTLTVIRLFIRRKQTA